MQLFSEFIFYGAYKCLKIFSTIIRIFGKASKSRFRMDFSLFFGLHRFKLKQ